MLDGFPLGTGLAVEDKAMLNFYVVMLIVFRNETWKK